VICTYIFIITLLSVFVGWFTMSVYWSPLFYRFMYKVLHRICPLTFPPSPQPSPPLLTSNGMFWLLTRYNKTTVQSAASCGSLLNRCSVLSRHLNVIRKITPGNWTIYVRIRVHHVHHCESAGFFSHDHYSPPVTHQPRHSVVGYCRRSWIRKLELYCLQYISEKKVLAFKIIY